jgi:hypothetical protein
MAEFKLGRIRFIWKNNWVSSTIYYKDDIVKNGGNMYVCISGHTSSSDFPTDAAAFWNKISDGQAWKNDWTTSTYYKENDIVKYGGYLYIANAAHTSAATNTLGIEADQAKWDLYAEGFDWKNNWSTSTRYKINDIVKYNSTVYICTEGHTSAVTSTLGLEVDQAKWDIFSKGLEWTGAWSTTTRYLVNDIVRYGGQIYICNQGHTSATTESLGLENDLSKWDIFSKGVEYKGEWSSTTRYKVNDLVKYGGSVRICVTAHTSQLDLTDDSAKWNEFIEGLEFEDSWNSTTRYQQGDLVTYGGYSYIAKADNVGIIPTQDVNSWELYVTGFNFRGEYADDSSAQDYRVGDVIRYGGYTYLCIKDHLYDVEIALNPSYTGFLPTNTTYWERLNEGISWKNAWADSAQYILGDAVRYNNNSYICILAHTSDETVDQNRPDQDVTGTYWNLLSGGPENNVMTTEGDIVYYGGAGPTRLPIGQPGQVLTVNQTATAPEWKYLGAINNVFYVETNNGLDEPAPVYGASLDQPWKTIRYATEQVEKGALRPNAKTLIELNRAFIQNETLGWVTAQISSGTGIWSGFTNDGEYLSLIEFGKVLSAIEYDISHNGNEKTRANTLTYFNEGTLVVALQDEDEQFVAALNYMETVIDAVLSNVPPSVTYSSFSQTIVSSLEEELDAQTVIGNLIDIATNAVTAGVTTGIPAEYIPNNTIFVKTGKFQEVLPIIIPKNTAVVGDELRSTRIEPAGSLISTADTPYTLDAILRLRDIVDPIVFGSDDIGKTAGNTEDPVNTGSVVGDSTVAAAASDLFQQIHDYIDFEINGGTSDSTTPTMTGSNTPNTDTAYTYAVEAIEKNRVFLVEEAIAWIKNKYPAYNFDEDKCRRDINRYIDAVKYDLIYPGNYRSLTAAKYYVNAVQGSTTLDMFYVRNGTGLRNCTVAGLSGTLSLPNAFGTRRPTAGAYVSLDPGWGPNDVEAWITNKSPYIQNVTTFGTGCVGCKVDGDLHAGGNDSIVANDFTQLVSDGIGVWVTNLGRSELVSVFSYYAHIGYLAENGGKIRATNGNSSYGTFGTVSEGIDSTEIPITGNVTNRSFDAIVDSIFTDGNNILTLQYLNAGQDYTPSGTTITLEGEGFGAEIDSVTTRDGAVFEVRLLDLNDSSGQFGGLGYVTATNAAQGGNATSITISNTDIATSGQYTGMAVYIIAGTGAGQYGYINSYNSGTKVATILKDSDGTSGWDHLVPGTAIETTLDNTTQYIIEPRLTFGNAPSALYSDRAKARAVVEDEQIVKILILDPGEGYLTPPTLTITDPNRINEAPTQVRIADGVLGQPTWTNRGTGFVTASATVSGDGFADRYQPGTLLRVENLSEQPLPGSNITFAGLPGQFFKLVVVRDFIGTPGNFSAQFQVSPAISITDAPEHLESIEVRNRFSQVRLTGHDFLDIGTGNFADTNYPNTPVNNPDPEKETVESAGGRVFFTSTDQDGNFRVGDLFSIEQATGIATLNADAFNISGLQELSLGELGLGGTGATITEFSTDGTFSANSDNIVPTQKAIKTYITSQIGGGAATLNVNSVTAGQVRISGREITTTNNRQINVNAKLNLKAGVNGVPIALNYFLNS